MSTANIQSWDIEKIIPYEKNSKKHDAEQVGKIARSIREFGWDQPIVVDKDGVIIKGHGRHLAAISLGMNRVPVIVRTDLTPEQVRAARLADNRVAIGDVDTQLLQKELQELSELEFDMSSMGFDDRELNLLTEELANFNEDALMGDDLVEEIAEHTETLEKKVKSAEERMVPLVEIFGAKVVSVDQARALNKLIAFVETETSAKGIEALVQYGNSVEW